MTEYFTIGEVEEMVREEAPEDYDGAFCWRRIKDGPRFSRHREEGTIIGSLQATQDYPTPPVWFRWHPEGESGSVLSVYGGSGKRLEYIQNAVLTDEEDELLTDWPEVRRRWSLTRNA